MERNEMNFGGAIALPVTKKKEYRRRSKILLPITPKLIAVIPLDLFLSRIGSLLKNKRGENSFSPLLLNKY
jgi:hypothetical protein